MTKARPFPLNAWYAVAWSHEIKQELVPAPFATRTSCCYRTVSAAIKLQRRGAVFVRSRRRW
jgi:hypothetical protein